MITWTFKPVDKDVLTTVKTSIFHGNEKFTSQTPNPEKYGDMQVPQLYVFNVLLSDAGFYECSTNLTQVTSGGHLSVVGQCSHLDIGS